MSIGIKTLFRSRLLSNFHFSIGLAERHCFLLLQTFTTTAAPLPAPIVQRPLCFSNQNVAADEKNDTICLGPCKPAISTNPVKPSDEELQHIFQNSTERGPLQLRDLSRDGTLAVEEISRWHTDLFKRQKQFDSSEERPEVGQRLRVAQNSFAKHRANKAIRNSRLKEKSEWSWDWQIPLHLLEQHYCEEQKSRRSPVVGNSSLSAGGKCFQIRASDIPQPLAWSTTSFSTYVMLLASSKVSRLMHRQLYNDGITHIESVATILQSVFQDPTLRLYFSVKAFDIALYFFYRHGMISRMCKIIDLMNYLHVTIPPKSYNIMLRCAAFQKDLHWFTFLLRGMIQCGVNPNSETWVTLIQAVSSKTAKVAIYRRMKQRGVTEQPRVVQRLFRELSAPEIPGYFSSRQDLGIFIQHMDMRHGPHWLSSHTGTQVCHQLSILGFHAEAIDMLGIMRNRGCKPDNITLNTLLNHCRRTKDPERATALVRLFVNEFEIHPNQSDFDSLFRLAWDNNLLNCCKVIWQVGCLQAAVSYRMQELVLNSLLRNTPQQPQSLSQKWMKVAGKVIVGIDLDAGRGRDESSASRTIMEELMGWTETGPARASSIALAKQMLGRDLEAMKFYTFEGDFVPLIEYALKLDRTWALDDEYGSTNWGVQRCVCVKVRLRSVSERRSTVEV